VLLQRSASGDDVSVHPNEHATPLTFTAARRKCGTIPRHATAHDYAQERTGTPWLLRVCLQVFLKSLRALCLVFILFF
jgi:hypothetical protein